MSHGSATVVDVVLEGARDVEVDDDAADERVVAGSDDVSMASAGPELSLFRVIRTVTPNAMASATTPTTASCQALHRGDLMWLPR